MTTITKQLAYEKAAIIDEAINEMLDKYPIEQITTRDEQLAWLTFTRTIRSTLDIIDANVLSPRPFGRAPTIMK